MIITYIYEITGVIWWDLNYTPRNGKQVALNVMVHVVSLAIILKNVTLSPVMSPKKRLK